jgi:hypothetical protein
LHSAGLPVDFASAVEIVLESTKVSTMVDERISLDISSEATTAVLGLLKMLDTDIDALADSLKVKETKSCYMAWFAVLTAKLNLYSFGLNQVTKLRTSDATQLRLSTFKAATEVIRLFVGTPFVSAQATPSNLPVQAFYPLNYWKGVFYACMGLIKLNITKGLPDIEMKHCEVTVQQVIVLLNACSTRKDDEHDRLAKLVLLLSQDAVQEILKPRQEVRSRMGASLMYEMILSAVAWKKQKERERQMTWEQQRALMTQSENSGHVGNTEKPTPGLYVETMDDFMASPGYFFEGLGPVGYDTNIWDTSVFDQVRLTIDSSFVPYAHLSQLFAYDTTSLGFGTL